MLQQHHGMLFPYQSKIESSNASSEELGELPEWNLNDLYPELNLEKIGKDIEKLQVTARKFEQNYKGQLVEIVTRGAKFAKIIREYEDLVEHVGRLHSFATLQFCSDQSDPIRKKFFADVNDKLNVVETCLIFFTLEINKLDDALIDQSLASNELTHYKPWITDIRKEREFLLDDQIEKLFHEKATTSFSAWNRLFNETMSTQKFLVDGKELSIEPTLNLLQNPNEQIRKNAATALVNTFKENLSVFTLITNTIAKDKEISDRWRGFEDVADSRHLANRVERKVVDALVEAVKQAYPTLSHRYYKLKAKWFGKEHLNFWDRNAPLPVADNRIIPWGEAKAIVLNAFEQFSPEIASIATKFFENNWIDAPVRPGKSPGAFSHPTVPSVHPYVLLNYLGQTRDVMTLAHELGHGVHQVLAGHNGPLMARTPLTLAETASVFGEMLTFRSLLKSIDEPKRRKVLLASKVEDMLNTVVRQISFYMFERKVHTERRRGELTSDKLGEIWIDVQSESLGPAIKLSEGYETFWSYIPHFIHAPFYVYAYAFGDCLVNSLYFVYEKSGADFLDKYLEMLRAGGTKYHAELLAPFELDANDPAFWRNGLVMIEQLIDEIEQLEESD